MNAPALRLLQESGGAFFGDPEIFQEETDAFLRSILRLYQEKGRDRVGLFDRHIRVDLAGFQNFVRHARVISAGIQGG